MEGAFSRRNWTLEELTEAFGEETIDGAALAQRHALHLQDGQTAERRTCEQTSSSRAGGLNDATGFPRKLHFVSV